MSTVQQLDTKLLELENCSWLPWTNHTLLSGGSKKSAQWWRSWYKALKIIFFLNMLLTWTFSSAYWRHQWRHWPVFFPRLCFVYK